MDWFTLAFISALFSAVSAISEKKALFSLTALNFSYVVSAVTLIFTMPFFFNIDYSTIGTTEIIILLVKTLLAATAFLCVMLAIKNLEISHALPLLAITPGLVAIAGVIFINDTLLAIEWAGIGLMLIGAYILEIHKGEKNFLYPFRALFSFTKFVYVFIALILFTISSLLDRVLLKDYQLPPYTFMAFQQLFYTCIFAGAVLIKNKNITEPFFGISKKLFMLIVFIGIFTVIYRYTQIEATRLAPVALVLSVKRLSILLAVVFGGTLFKDENLIVRITAVIIILVGTTLLLIN